MVFSSTIFLFLFLPIVILAYFMAGSRGRNLVLLLASLVFYAWGETIYLLLMLTSISLNYVVGLLLEHSRRKGASGRGPLIFGLTANLGLLGFFKYGNFLVDNFNGLLAVLHISPVVPPSIHLPIGISFFTFQAMSYVVDLYKGVTRVQKNPVNMALYISLFPQLIAGPIVRYHDIAGAIDRRTTSSADFAAGTQRFIIGMGKKVLIANELGQTADYLFSLPPDRLPATLAWVGALAYTFQIYYDFSGYSDMAIGLGRMFGFHFPENFNFPYISQSIREFWRRWHISLSTWFRDYLYFPLGGSRKSPARTYINLVTVFFLCGLWHGASWTFVVWGLYHGLFLVLERTGPGKRVLEAMPPFLRTGYAMLVVIIGWVMFRAETFSYGFYYIRAMFSPGRPPLYNSQIFLNMNSIFYFTFAVAALCFLPLDRIAQTLRSRCSGKGRRSILPVAPLLVPGRILALALVFVYSVANIMGSSYNPFLYFRF